MQAVPNYTPEDSAAHAARGRPGLLARGWSWWRSILNRRERATSLAICRILTGVTLLHDLVTMWLSGSWRLVWVDEKYGGVLPLAPPAFSWFHPGTPRETAFVMGVTALGAVLTAIGLFTRLGLVLSWLGIRVLGMSSVVAAETSDSVLINLSLPLVLSGCGRRFSVDALFWRRPQEVMAWPRYLLIVQMVLMYWMAGVQKLSSGWIPGGAADAVWYILQWTHWQKQSFEWVAPWYWLTQVATLGTWTLENAAPLFLLAFWYRHTRDRPGRLRAWFNRCDFRSIYVALGASMHLGIWLTLEVGMFFGYCMAYFACCFTPEEWQRWVFSRFSRLAAALGSRTARLGP
jgi:hypothetical protein